MTIAVREAPHHDASTCVKWYNCQLPDCRDRLNARRRALRAGTIQPSRILVDAEPVRQRILELQEAGLSASRIACLSGLTHTTILAFLHAKPSVGRGRKRHTTPETAAKILAVRPLSTTGTLRRIQALIAIGWTARKIADRAGVSARRIIELRPTEIVNLGTAEKIAAAYEVLRHLNPEKNGVWPGHAKRSRERAKANHWPDPKYWATRMDAIDDPHFEPLYGITRRLIIAQDANEVMRFAGLDRQAAADRLGVHKSYLDHAFREYPQYDVDVAA